MQNPHYTIRTMTRQEVDIAIDWAAAEGWNPGLNDAECFHAADPNGFFLGLLGDEPIVTISAVKYGDTFGFLGCYIVKPEQRGKGYGIALWNAALAYLEGRTIGLDGVVERQGNYQQSGFVLAHRNIRYQGTGSRECPTGLACVELSTLPFDWIEAYDRAFFPAGRGTFLRCWINQPHSVALGILRNGTLAGYGVLRRCRSGFKIGPLFADSPNVAERLFLALQAHAPEAAPVFLDIPAVNPAALDLVRRHGMVPVFETARMYLGESPAVPINRLFGVTSFELG